MCFVKKICLHFILYLHVWIRIHIPNTDPILIRIHNTGFMNNFLFLIQKCSVIFQKR